MDKRVFMFCKCSSDYFDQMIFIYFEFNYFKMTVYFQMNCQIMMVVYFQEIMYNFVSMIVLSRIVILFSLASMIV